VLGLIRDVEIGPSSYTIQRRLKLAGMRPINKIVDATNYTMLEIGEPLHAFDYDALVQRAAGKKVKIITRTAKEGETLKTLDGVERKLDENTVLVCDSAGALSIAGVMGGLESEVNATTRNVLLEGAAWNFINIRKTSRSQNLFSEASFRFSRGVHPSVAVQGVRRGLELMRQWSGGVVADGLVDNYPLPPEDPTVEIAPIDVKRWLGIDLSATQIADLLRRLEFKVEVQGDTVRATCPDHRLDINNGISGKADLVEEVARVYGYDHIPGTRMKDEIPPQRGNPALEKEERIRDLLVVQGLQEIINYRFTTPEREARRLRPDTPPVDKPHVRILNPIASDKAFLRQSVLASVLDTAEGNARLRERLGLFEIGPAFLASEGGDLPDELQHLAILLAGPRALPGWQPTDTNPVDFYDLKGILAALLGMLHIPDVRYEPVDHPTFHPGKCARIVSGETQVGVFGELHPLVRQNYDWPVTYAKTPVLAADLNLDTLLALIPPLYETVPPPEFPPVLEDLAVVVDEALPAGQVEALIRQTGGRVVAEVRLFDVYRGDQVGKGKKSLAYSITYMAPDKTLTDRDVAGIRTRIVRRLEQELNAVLRG
jgi:phenylalanyl-tRNA synthetase beta chain